MPPLTDGFQDRPTEGLPTAIARLTLFQDEWVHKSKRIGATVDCLLANGPDRPSDRAGTSTEGMGSALHPLRDPVGHLRPPASLTEAGSSQGPGFAETKFASGVAYLTLVSETLRYTGITGAEFQPPKEQLR